MTTRDTRSQTAKHLDALAEQTDDLEMLLDGFPASAAHVVTGTADTATVITLAAPAAGSQHALGSVTWSYSAAPADGTLVITAGGVDVFRQNLGTDVRDTISFTPMLLCGDAAEVVITLGAGGAGVTGTLSLHAGVI
jgi:hypothetical protein